MTSIRTLAVLGLLVTGVSSAYAQTEAETAPAAEPTVTEQTQASAAPVTASASLSISLESTGDIERRVANYLCDDGTSLNVQYINAAPNFLAVVPVRGENLIFATTISASGSRYISGPFEWWSKGDEATLVDLMQDEGAAPLATCTAASNTP